MKAIDIHAHIPRMPGIPEYGIEPGLRRMFRMNDEPDDIAIDTMAVIFSVDAETETGDLPDPNDYVAETVAAYPDVLMGFASVDPRKGATAVIELDRAVTDLGLRGLKLHPIHQAFFPDDPAVTRRRGRILRAVGGLSWLIRDRYRMSIHLLRGIPAWRSSWLILRGRGFRSRLRLLCTSRMFLLIFRVGRRSTFRRS